MAAGADAPPQTAPPRPAPSADELKDHRHGAIRGSLSAVSHAHRCVKRLKSFRKLEMRSDRQQRAVPDEEGREVESGNSGGSLRRAEVGVQRGPQSEMRNKSQLKITEHHSVRLPERGISTLSVSQANAPPRRSAARLPSPPHPTHPPAPPPCVETELKHKLFYQCAVKEPDVHCKRKFDCS